MRNMKYGSDMDIRRFAKELCWFAASVLALGTFACIVKWLDAITAGKVLDKRPGAVRTASYRGLRRISGYSGAANTNGVLSSAWSGCGKHQQHHSRHRQPG